MIYEYRFYQVCDGRLTDEAERLADVSVRPAPPDKKFPPHQSLFDRHGVPRPVGAWTAISGTQLPLLGYLLRWDSLTQRDTAFPSYWNDPLVHALHDEDKGDRVPLVSRIDDWLIEPSYAWIKAREDGPNVPLGGLHEMRIHYYYAQQGSEAAKLLGEIELPHLQLMGATLLGSFDVIIGPKDAIVTFLAWPDYATQQRALARLDVEPQLRYALSRFATRRGRPLFRKLDQYLLTPLDYAIPKVNFGEDEGTLSSFVGLIPFNRQV